MSSAKASHLRIEPMAAADWHDVRRIYAQGIATGDATLEREAPDWNHFDHSHPAAGALAGSFALGGFPKPGDVVTLRIERLGELTNPIVTRPNRT